MNLKDENKTIYDLIIYDDVLYGNQSSIRELIY